MQAENMSGFLFIVVLHLASGTEFVLCTMYLGTEFVLCKMYLGTEFVLRI